MAKFFVNGEAVDFLAAPDTPLLWVLREQLGLTGTKFGCGVAACGACTVNIDGVDATRAGLRHDIALPVGGDADQQRAPIGTAQQPCSGPRASQICATRQVPAAGGRAQPVRIDHPTASLSSIRPSAAVASSTTGTPAC